MAAKQQLQEAETGSKYNVFVVITLDEFLEQTEGGNLMPVLTLVNDHREIVQQFDLEIRPKYAGDVRDDR
jgi:hypothetical protein